MARSLFGMRSPHGFRRVLVAVTLTTLLVACSDDDSDNSAEVTRTTTSTTADDDRGDESDADGASTSSQPAEESPPGMEVNENEGLDDPIVAVADLTADQVVPGPGAVDTTGRFELVAETSEQLCVDLVLENAPAGADNGHVHVGAVGETGRIAIDLGLDSVQPSTDGTTTRWDDVCMPLKPALIESLSVSTDAYYMQIHSADYPDGAARGQLRASSLFDLELS